MTGLMPAGNRVHGISEVGGGTSGVADNRNANWLVARELADGRLVKVLPEWTAEGEMGATWLVRPCNTHQPNARLH